MKISCPKCNAKQDAIRYVQDATEYWHIGEVFDDGNVDLAGMAESFAHDDYHFYCTVCEHKFTI